MRRWLTIEWLRASGPGMDDEDLEGRALLLTVRAFGGHWQITLELMRRVR